MGEISIGAALVNIASGVAVGTLTFWGWYAWRRRGNREVYQVRRGKSGRFE